MAIAKLKKAIPYAAAVLGGAGLGGALGYGKGKKSGTKRGREQGAIAAARHFRRGANIRNRALQVFSVRNQQLSRQNRALRNRIGELASERKRAT
ncbi:hypothetical protein LCGC14_0516510 [marine sediment metagenome]|uniref:Uncharacterized protein n=1 Tax=marine sediment metagenome TaxID=412755 RepID=A0A0F9V7Y9_9ZZZZ